MDNKEEVYIEPAADSAPYPMSGLGVAVRIIGIINVIIGCILGFVLCGQEGMFSNGYDENPMGLILFIISGIIVCIICFALARCVDAADKYLKS